MPTVWVIFSEYDIDSVYEDEEEAKEAYKKIKKICYGMDINMCEAEFFRKMTKNTNNNKGGHYYFKMPKEGGIE